MSDDTSLDASVDPLTSASTQAVESVAKISTDLDLDLEETPGADSAESDSDAAVNIVQLLSPKLDSAQRRFLRAQAHTLKPVVLVGNKGVTDALIEQVEAALLAHELIRIKVHDREALDETATLIHNATSAQLAQRIGKTLLFFRAHPAEPTIQLPGAPLNRRARVKVKKSTGSHGHRRKVALARERNAARAAERAARPERVKAPKAKDDAPRNANGRRARPGKKKKDSGK